jgi:pimeloyl-ACP methyl ester carboxylesterase
LTTYLLIHGSQQGSWIWTPTALRLSGAGHQVHVPTLEGFAERRHEFRDDLTADAHAAEMTDYLFYTDLRDVVLVSTSIAGIVACKVAEAASDRIDRLVFVDALVLFDGETVYDVVRPDTNASTFSDTDFEDADLAAWARARATPTAQGLLATPVRVPDSFWDRGWTATVIRCSRSANPAESHQRRTAERLNAKYVEIDCGHYPMLSDPDVLAPLLLEA